MVTIGVTYDLRSEYLAAGYSLEETAELDQEETVDAVCEALANLGYTVERIGRMQSLVTRLAAGARWDLVFNIAEGLHGDARESQIPALLDAFTIPYTFSSPKVLACCLDKELCKLILRNHCLPTPDWRVVSRIEDLTSECISGLNFPLFAKPLAEGTSKGITALSKIVDYPALTSRVSELLIQFAQPVLIEEFLPGDEFTVALVGSDERTEVLGILGITLLSEGDNQVYSFENKERCESLVSYTLLSESDERYAAIAKLAIDSWKFLSCRDAGRIDIRYAANRQPSLIEVNPLAGLHPTHSDMPIIATQLGMSYKELVGRILEEALLRLERSARREGCSGAKERQVASCNSI